MKIRALIAYIFIILKKALLRYITQIIIICIAIPILFLIAVSLRITYQDLTLESLTRRETIAQLAANLVKERFDSLKELGLSLATRQRFRELVRDQKWNEAIQVMETIPTDFPYIERVFITDVQGNLKSDYPSVAGVKNMNFSYRDWYKGVTNEWKPYISEIST